MSVSVLSLLKTSILSLLKPVVNLEVELLKKFLIFSWSWEGVKKAIFRFFLRPVDASDVAEDTLSIIETLVLHMDVLGGVELFDLTLSNHVLWFSSY